MRTSEALNKAADLIEERGWTTGNEGIWTDGPLCILGGIGAAYDMDDVFPYDDVHLAYNPTACVDSPAGQVIRDYIGHAEVDEHKQVWSWNDEIDGKGNYLRTAEEIVETLRAAAVIEAAKETADERETADA